MRKQLKDPAPAWYTDREIVKHINAALAAAHGADSDDVASDMNVPTFDPTRPLDTVKVLQSVRIGEIVQGPYGITPRPVRKWFNEADHSNKKINIILHRGEAFRIHEKSIFDRWGNLFQELDETGELDNVTPMAADNALRHMRDGVPIFDMHAWVPTKKTLKGSHRSRVGIPFELMLRIPNEAAIFMMLDDARNSMVSGSSSYRLHKWNAVNNYQFYLSLMDYSTWSYDRDVDTGKDVLTIEIHSYGTRRMAFQLRVYLLEV